MKRFIAFIPLILLLLMLLPGNTKEPLEKFPRLEATTLAGRSIVFPDSLYGSPSMVVMVFEDFGRYVKPQLQANEWVALWENELKDQGIVFYEIPMISAGYKVGSHWIDNSMRAGIPSGKHDNIATYYGRKKRYKRKLGLQSLSDAHVFLLDAEGRIVSSVSGPPEGDKLDQFRASIPLLAR